MLRHPIRVVWINSHRDLFARPHHFMRQYHVHVHAVSTGCDDLLRAPVTVDDRRLVSGNTESDWFARSQMYLFGAVFFAGLEFGGRAQLFTPISRSAKSELIE